MDGPGMRRMDKIPRGGTLRLAVLLSSIPFLFLTLFFAFNERGLRASYGYGILDLELVWTTGMTEKIFTAWGPIEMDYQAFVHYVDFLYLVCYGAFGALFILLIARGLRGRLRDIGFLFVLAPPLAAIFDLVENVFLLSLLKSGTYMESSSPALASLCATLKIVFLGATVSFLIIASLLLLANRYRIPLGIYYLVLLVVGAIGVWLGYGWKPYVCYVIGSVYLAVALLFAWIMTYERRHQGREAPA